MSCCDRHLKDCTGANASEHKSAHRQAAAEEQTGTKVKGEVESEPKDGIEIEPLPGFRISDNEFKDDRRPNQTAEVDSKKDSDSKEALFDMLHKEMEARIHRRREQEKMWKRLENVKRPSLFRLP